MDLRLSRPEMRTPLKSEVIPNSSGILRKLGLLRSRIQLRSLAEPGPGDGVHHPAVVGAGGRARPPSSFGLCYDSHERTRSKPGRVVAWALRAGARPISDGRLVYLSKHGLQNARAKDRTKRSLGSKLGGPEVLGLTNGATNGASLV